MLPHFQGPHRTTKPSPQVNFVSLINPRTWLPQRTEDVACAVFRRCTALSHLPPSVASLVVPCYRCCERRLPMKSHADLIAAKKHQPPWSATSSQPDKHAATHGRRHNLECHHMSLATPSNSPLLCQATTRPQSPMAIEVADIATSRVGSLETKPPMRLRCQWRVAACPRFGQGFLLENPV